MPTYIAKYGYEAAAEISKFEIDHLNAIKDLVEEEQIDCDLTVTRSFDVFLDDEHARTSKEGYDRMIRSGITTIKDAHYTPASQAESVRHNSVVPETMKGRFESPTNTSRSAASKALAVASASPPPISGPISSSCICSHLPSPKVPIFRPPPRPLISLLVLTATVYGRSLRRAVSSKLERLSLLRMHIPQAFLHFMPRKSFLPNPFVAA